MILSAGMFVLARTITRYHFFRLGADDYAIVASLAFSIILSVNIQLAVVHGYGKHKRDLTISELRTCLKYFWIAQTPYKIVLCYGALAIVIGSGIATSFATIFQCLPLEKSWNKSIEQGTCIDNSKFWLANAVLNIGTDVVVLALPIREIFRLQLRFREKWMICVIFMVGGFVTITSVLRVTAVANSVRNQKDQTWSFIQRGVWTLIEANLGIICSCLPVLRQLGRRIVQGVSSTMSKVSQRNDDRGSTNTGIRQKTSKVSLLSARSKV